MPPCMQHRHTHAKPFLLSLSHNTQRCRGSAKVEMSGNIPRQPHGMWREEGAGMEGHGREGGREAMCRMAAGTREREESGGDRTSLGEGEQEKNGATWEKGIQV